MPRYALKLEYDGTGYSGWQLQENVPSVQGALEAAITALEPGGARTYCAGRTDAGVHATGQVAHMELSKAWECSRLMAALNAHLRDTDVAVLAAVEVNDAFHARFSAVERRYMYRIALRRAPLKLDATRLWRIGHTLDTEAMQEAAAHLIGKHDFTTFRSAECQSDSPVRSMESVSIETLDFVGGKELRLRFSARSFLHKQIRSIVGSLERVGAGAWSSQDFNAALKAADRARCGPVAPPHGLYLTYVGYDPDPF